ncbi:hypothetical protein L218DRAFT_948272 [Marasmius fiardii PR-910]|nr:hypothetical protein L218DRAFT_948272 [Marasmius fiardii PR-910]
MPWGRFCTLLILLDSWAFLFTSMFTAGICGANSFITDKSSWDKVAFFLVIVDTHHDLILCSVGMFACTLFHNLDRLLIYTYLVEKNLSAGTNGIRRTGYIVSPYHLTKAWRKWRMFSEVRGKHTERIKSSFKESSKEDSYATGIFVMITAGPDELDLEHIALVSVDVCPPSFGAIRIDSTDVQITLTVGDHWAVESVDNNVDHER